MLLFDVLFLVGQVALFTLHWSHFRYFSAVIYMIGPNVIVTPWMHFIKCIPDCLDEWCNQEGG